MALDGHTNEDTGVVRDLSSAQPYRQAARQYLKAGWFPFPLKPKLKEPWASGVTGRKNAFPSEEGIKVGEWLVESPPRANIGLWLRENVIGIDVDHYDDKRGGDTLARLEAKLGKLPETWTSSARDDGISGIRFFRIPEFVVTDTGVKVKCVGKLQWSGKAGEAVDIIQTGHRYAAVWPSWNPEAGPGASYQWYPPGQTPSGRPDRWYAISHRGGRLHFNGLIEVPKVSDLPELPEPWVAYLTRGYVEKTDRPIDMETTGDEVLQWAIKNFGRAYRTETEDGRTEWVLCRELQKRLDNAIAEAVNSDTSHDKLVAGHWSILSCGIEGHRGVMRAVKRFEKEWHAHTKELENRSLRQAEGELFRSRIEALRKLKGKADEAQAAGGDPFRTACGCPDPTRGDPKPSQDVPKPSGTVSDPSEYEPTHDGTADFFTQLFGGDIHWVESEKSWYLWNGQRWEQDATGLIHRMFRLARERMLDAGENLVRAAMADQKIAEGVGGVEEEIAKAKSTKAKDYLKWAKSCGNNANRNGSLEHARSVFGISVRKESFNQNRGLLAVANGVIELPLHGAAQFRESRREDLLTLSTETPYIPTVDQVRAGGELAMGVRLLREFQEVFVPDLDYWKWIQMCLASSLYGYNLETKMFFVKGETRSGKSTITGAVAKALGPYAGSPGKGVYDTKDSGLTPALTQAFPKRVLVDSEFDEHNSMDANLLKKITGRDMLSSENKGSNIIIEDIPAFTIWISTNHVPMIHHMDLALRERIMVLPFDQQVFGAEDKKAALTELRDSAKAAILAWMVEGWADYRELGGLGSEVWPENVTNATQLFFGEISPVGLWAREQLAEQEGHFEDAVEMYDCYRRYAEWQRIPEKDILTRHKWAAAMNAVGYKIANHRIDGEQGRRVWNVKYLGPQLKNVGEFRVQKG